MARMTNVDDDEAWLDLPLSAREPMTAKDPRQLVEPCRISSRIRR